MHLASVKPTLLAVLLKLSVVQMDMRRAARYNVVGSAARL